MTQIQTKMGADIQPIYKIMKHIILLTIFLISTAYSSDHIPRVSMIKLIANPKLYEGKVIETQGYYYGKNEIRQLFFSAEDCRYAIFENSILIDDFDASIRDNINFDEGYVVLKGKYYAPSVEQDVRNQNGVITNIVNFTRINKKK